MPGVLGWQRARKRRRGKPLDHVYNGWPHYSSAYPHHCLCLDNCCQDDELGCVCKSCPCTIGIMHGSTVRTEAQALEAIAEYRKEQAKK